MIKTTIAAEITPSPAVEAYNRLIIDVMPFPHCFGVSCDYAIKKPLNAALNGIPIKTAPGNSVATVTGIQTCCARRSICATRSR